MTYDHVKEWRKNTKQKLFEAFGQKCAICGIEEHPVAYDFHHLNEGEDKEFQLCKQIRSWEKIKSEAQKCVMLCVICHRKVHADLVVVPDDAQQFDETLIRSVKRVVTMNDCPICGTSKPVKQRTCSKSCAKKHRGGIGWDELDLTLLLKEHGSLNKIADHFKVSFTAVKKQFVKRGVEYKVVGP